MTRGRKRLAVSSHQNRIGIETAKLVADGAGQLLEQTSLVGADAAVAGADERKRQQRLGTLRHRGVRQRVRRMLKELDHRPDEPSRVVLVPRRASMCDPGSGQSLWGLFQEWDHALSLSWRLSGQPDTIYELKACRPKLPMIQDVAVAAAPKTGGDKPPVAVETGDIPAGDEQMTRQSLAILASGETRR